jgi:hypothetical protein
LTLRFRVETELTADTVGAVSEEELLGEPNAISAACVNTVGDGLRLRRKQKHKSKVSTQITITVVFNVPSKRVQSAIKAFRSMVVSTSIARNGGQEKVTGNSKGASTASTKQLRELIRSTNQNTCVNKNKCPLSGINGRKEIEKQKRSKKSKP